MPIPLKADTAVEVLVGPAVAVGDGFTPVTNLVGASADEYELLKYNGATKLVAAAPTNALSAITGADGYYSLELATGDVDTEGPLWLIINDDSLVLPIRHEFVVVPANVYDAFYAVAGTDNLKVDALEINSVAGAAAQLALSAGQIVSGTVDTPTTFTATVTQFEADDITEATADHYNGRIIIFLAGSALAGQATTIEDYALQNSKGFFTVTALTEAPANNATFIIV